jgi:hypothetical protein
VGTCGQALNVQLNDIEEEEVLQGVSRVLKNFSCRRGYGSHDFHLKGRSPFIDCHGVL